MRKLYIVFALIGFASFNAQTDKEKFLDKATDHTCKCVENKKNASPKDLQLELGLCIMEFATQNKAEFEKYYQTDDLRQAGKSLGKDIGGRMPSKCPESFTKIMEMAMENKASKDKLLEEINEDAKKEEIKEVKEENPSINVEFLSTLINKQFFLNTVESNGKKHEFVLLTDFENSYLLTDKVLKAKDKIKVTYYELEIYNKTLNKFIVQKVISDIQKL